MKINKIPLVCFRSRSVAGRTFFHIINSILLSRGSEACMTPLRVISPSDEKSVFVQIHHALNIPDPR
jgi:hypothetical protein